MFIKYVYFAKVELSQEGPLLNGATPASFDNEERKIGLATKTNAFKRPPRNSFVTPLKCSMVQWPEFLPVCALCCLCNDG